MCPWGFFPILFVSSMYLSHFIFYFYGLGYLLHMPSDAKQGFSVWVLWVYRLQLT